MGIRLKLEEIDSMDSLHPLSEIKTGFTPTRIMEDSTKPFARYEDLDTPQPLKSTDFMAYLNQQDPFPQPRNFFSFFTIYRFALIYSWFNYFISASIDCNVLD